jgi:hypothetical protein
MKTRTGAGKIESWRARRNPVVVLRRGAVIAAFLSLCCCRSIIVTLLLSLCCYRCVVIAVLLSLRFRHVSFGCVYNAFAY